MASSTDFKKLYDLYQLEGVKKGISIVQFCKMNGIVYSHFERWYKQDRVANVVPVKLVDRDGLSVSPVDTLVSEELSSSGTDTSIQCFEILWYRLDYTADDGHRQNDHGIPLFECPRD